jgi:hypothetical protein
MQYAMPRDARNAGRDKEPAPGGVRQTGEYRERAATGEQREHAPMAAAKSDSPERQTGGMACLAAA